MINRIDNDKDFTRKTSIREAHDCHSLPKTLPGNLL